MRWSKTFVVALCVLGTAACVTSGKYEQKSKEAVANDVKAQEAAARATACEEKVAAMQKELDSVAKAKSDLEVRTAALAQEKGAAEAKSAQYEKLVGSMQRQIQSGQVEISELRGRMVVKLKDKILFSSGSATLNKDGRAALDEIADAFKDMKGKNVVVGGFTDDVPVSSGPYKDNWELSTARAISVVRYLASKGVPPESLGAAGFSQFRPIAANDSPANRSLNRRIEIALTPADWQPPEVEAK